MRPSPADVTIDFSSCRHGSVDTGRAERAGRREVVAVAGSPTAPRVAVAIILDGGLGNDDDNNDDNGARV